MTKNKTKLKKVFTVIQLIAVMALYLLPQVQASAQAILAEANNDTYTVEAGQSLPFNVFDNDTP